MPEFNFKNTDDDYFKRTKSSLAINLAVSILFGLIVASSVNVWLGIGTALLLFLIQDFKADRQDKVYINKICFDNKDLALEFTDRNTKHTLTGSVTEFEFKKGFAIEKARTPYLSVYQNKDLKTKQFVANAWTESKMDEVVNAHTFLLISAKQ